MENFKKEMMSKKKVEVKIAQPVKSKPKEESKIVKPESKKKVAPKDPKLDEIVKPFKVEEKSKSKSKAVVGSKNKKEDKKENPDKNDMEEVPAKKADAPTV